MAKSTQSEQNWVLFFRKWYTDGWVIVQKIGIETYRESQIFEVRQAHQQTILAKVSPSGFSDGMCLKKAQSSDNCLKMLGDQKWGEKAGQLRSP